MQCLTPSTPDHFWHRGKEKTASKQRVRLSRTEKLAILTQCESRGTVKKTNDYREIRGCIASKLDVAPSYKTVKRIIADKHRIWKMAKSAAAEIKSVGTVTSMEIVVN